MEVKGTAYWSQWESSHCFQEVLELIQQDTNLFWESMYKNISITAQGFADTFLHSVRHFLCITQIPQVPTLVFSTKRPKMRSCLLATTVMQKINILIKPVWDPRNPRLLLIPTIKKIFLNAVFWLLSFMCCSRLFGGWKDVILWYNKLNFLINSAERLHRTAWWLRKISNYVHRATL